MKNKKKLKKIAIILVIICIIIVYTMCFIYWKTSINKEFSCIQFKLNEKQYKPIDVKIKGVIKRSLLRQDIMEVNLKIGDKEIPDLKSHPNIISLKAKTVAKNKEMCFNPTTKVERYIENVYKNSSFIYLLYNYWDNSTLSIEDEFYGVLIFDEDIDNIILTIYNDNGWSSVDGEVIVSATNLQDAQEILTKLQSDY